MAHSEIDWITPPQPAEWTSLWAAFHDAILLMAASDSLGRTVDLKLEIGFPEPSFAYPKTILIRAEEVTHFYLFLWNPWPGPIPQPPVSEQDRETYRIETDSFRSKARVETRSVKELEDWLAGENQNYVMEAEFAEQGSRAWLRIYGNGNGEFISYEIRIVAGSLRFSDENGSEIPIDRLLDIGMAAWDEWSERSSDARSSRSTDES